MAPTNGDASPNLSNTDEFPVWDNDGNTDVQSLFKTPYFVDKDPNAAAAVGELWYKNMVERGLFLLDKPGQVNNGFESGTSLRLWVNQGGRVRMTDHFPNSNMPKSPISPPSNVTRPFVVPDHPVWDSGSTEDDIKYCFTNPCWIANGAGAASGWQSAMLNFQYDVSVDPLYLWICKNTNISKDGLGTYTLMLLRNRCQYQHHFSLTKLVKLSDSGSDADRSISAVTLEKPFLVRKDINTLTPDELTAYREALMKIQAESLENPTWQVGGFLHADWCLHYMQASFPWHRAHLLWLETQIGIAILYWNFFSSQAADPTSKDSGIPQAFLDDTFVGSDQETYPNPLRHALARKGVSRASTAPNPLKEVQRAQPFVQPDGPIKRNDYITQNVPGYLDTIHQAISSSNLAKQNDVPFTWTATGIKPQDLQKLNDLTDQNNPAFYSSVSGEFDSLLEQAHDNLHGWAGPDMANNSFAAFDPLFWSFHANFDRLFETWVRAHDEIDWASNYPLRPFVGREGPITVSEGDKFTYRYTTIGNMVVNSKALGYTYAPPGNPDYFTSAGNVSMDIAPIVMFPDIQCTDKTYIIQTALNPDNDDKPLVVVGAPGYICSITRLGMGPDNGNNRCISGFVTRRLEASKAVNDIGSDRLTPDTDVPLKMLVIEDYKGVRREVPHSEYKDWKGFRPLVVWAKLVAGVVAH